MAIQVNEVLTTYGLNVKILAYVKDERNNISTMTIVVTFVVSCELLKFTTPFIGSCWWHAMSKCCKYATNDTKVYTRLTLISIKECQSILQKTITWTKKSGKGCQE
jgi:hypothetical protein